MNDSFILKSWNDPLTQFILNFVNDHSFIRIGSLRNQYLEKHIEKNLRSIGIFIGKIIKELVSLDLIQAWSNSKTNRTYKKKFTRDIFVELDERMDQMYHIIKLKTEE